MSLGMTYSPTVPGGGAASYKLRPVFTYQIQRIRGPYCRRFKLLSTKMWNFAFFARRQITDACLFVFFLFFFVVVFPRGDRIDPVVLECREMAHSNEN